MGTVTVYGGNVMNGPLVETDKAQCIAIRDKFGDLMSLTVRFAEDQWLFSKRDDKDWEHVCARYGFGPQRPLTLNDLIPRT